MFLGLPVQGPWVHVSQDFRDTRMIPRCSREPPVQLLFCLSSPGYLDDPRMFLGPPTPLSEYSGVPGYSDDPGCSWLHLCNYPTVWVSQDVPGTTCARTPEYPWNPRILGRFQDVPRTTYPSVWVCQDSRILRWSLRLPCAGTLMSKTQLLLSVSNINYFLLHPINCYKILSQQAVLIPVFTPSVIVTLLRLGGRSPRGIW